MCNLLSDFIRGEDLGGFGGFGGSFFGRRDSRIGMGRKESEGFEWEFGLGVLGMWVKTEHGLGAG